MLRFSVAERGMLPLINISQTVPLIALAPIVVTWGRTNDWGDSLSVSLIATSPLKETVAPLRAPESDVTVNSRATSPISPLEAAMGPESRNPFSRVTT